MVDFHFQEMFPQEPADVPFRKLTDDLVSVGEYRGNQVLEVDREALTLLLDEAQGLEVAYDTSRSA